MSGTSLDGLDIAACIFDTHNKNLSYKIIHAETIAYSDEWIDRLTKAYNGNPHELKELNLLYGQYLGDQVNDFINRHQLEIELIGSHGHTIFHQPKKGITVQIGSGEVIRNKTGIPVICNFRKQDVELGGQGAPLVPIGDKLLFSDYSFCLNLGGFSNISFEKENRRIAYDISPCNILLNHLSIRMNRSFDEDGNFARKGSIIHSLLQKWNDLSYFQLSPPKSLGREWFESNYLKDINSDNYQIEDLLRTSVEHITQVIAHEINENDSHKEQKILMTGGGAHNTFLMERLKEKTNSTVQFTPVDNSLIDYKEALIFALLAYLRYRGEINVLSSVTGSIQNHSSGDVFFNENNLLSFNHTRHIESIKSTN